MRGGLLPLQLVPPNPRFPLGAGPTTLTLRMGAVGTMRLRGGAEQPEGLPFGSLALTLRDVGARPGAGSLAGNPGAGDVRLVPLENGEATIEYTPPDAPGVDFLVVALADASGGQGIELGRFRLVTRGG